MAEGSRHGFSKRNTYELGMVCLTQSMYFTLST
uniref:Uncharacterized protein n=1 Tax=Arundo donax TaxID=35708 RepID=A0A0A9AMC7_ARUDO